MATKSKKRISSIQQDKLLNILQERFAQHMHRHKGLVWSKIQAKLEATPSKLWSLYEMEKTGGEPDVIGYDKKKDTYMFVDCSLQSPSGRRSCCYDRQAQKGRKQHPSKTNALDMATAMGIELLTEEQYRSLQMLEKFDTTTSSRVQTPANIRNLGGALFCDRRYETVFLYHNGADSYYAARGFRGMVKV